VERKPIEATLQAKKMDRRRKRKTTYNRGDAEGGDGYTTNNDAERKSGAAGKNKRGLIDVHICIWIKGRGEL